MGSTIAVSQVKNKFLPKKYLSFAIAFDWLTLSKISNTYYAYAVWALLTTPVILAVVAAACQKLCMLHTPQATVKTTDNLKL